MSSPQEDAVEQANVDEAPAGKRTWTTPDVEDMDVGRNTYNGGPTFLDTGAFS